MGAEVIQYQLAFAGFEFRHALFLDHPDQGFIPGRAVEFLLHDRLDRMAACAAIKDLLPAFARRQPEQRPAAGLVLGMRAGRQGQQQGRQ